MKAIQDDELVTPGVLTIGVDASPPPPLNFGVPGAANFEGFEVDLTRALAERLGLGVTYVAPLWSRMLEDLREGRIDLVCTAATVTAERARIVDFSEPYLDTALGIVTRTGSRLRTAADLAGARVGARVATVAEEFARGGIEAAPVRTFDFNTDAYAALGAGEIDAVIDDVPIGTHFARSLPGLVAPAPIPGTESHYAFMFAKGNDRLREAVNRALRELREEGAWLRMRGTWFADQQDASSLGLAKEKR
jgi:polar amino acid transport system substrate-binding protein